MRVSLQVIGENASPLFFDLPVEVGRGAGDVLFASNDERTEVLDVVDRKVSRTHLRILSEGDSIILEDLSRNGTYELESGSARRLPTLSNSASAPRYLKIGDTHFEVTPTVTPGDETLVVVTTPGGRREFIELDGKNLIVGTRNEKVRCWLSGDDQHQRHDLKTEIFAVTSRSGSLQLFLPDHPSTPVYCNRGEVSGETRSLQHLDVIEAAGHRFTVWTASGNKGLVCPNHDCLLPNPYDARKNCVYCGAKLDAGQTFVVE